MSTKPVESETQLLPASEMIDRELVELALESHSRAVMYPNSKVQHDRANECRDELLKRLARVPSEVKVDAEDKNSGSRQDEMIRVMERAVKANAALDKNLGEGGTEPFSPAVD